MRQPRKPKGSPGGVGGQYDTIKGGGAEGLPAMSGPTVADVEQALAPLVERARVEERDGVFICWCMSGIFLLIICYHCWHAGS
jgi:hypothetical protein